MRYQARTRQTTTGSRRSRASGSAALEVLLLMVFIILPVYVLLFNMGYNGMRQRESQNAMRLSAYLYVDRLATSDSPDKAKAAAQAEVNGRLFAGEKDAKNGKKAATVTLPSADTDTGEKSIFPAALKTVLSDMRIRQTVAVEVTRTAPLFTDSFASTPIKRTLIVGASTFTYCELQGKFFKSDDPAWAVVSFLGEAALWPFGVLGPNDDVCA